MSICVDLTANEEFDDRQMMTPPNDDPTKTHIQKDSDHNATIPKITCNCTLMWLSQTNDTAKNLPDKCSLTTGTVCRRREALCWSYQPVNRLIRRVTLLIEPWHQICSELRGCVVACIFMYWNYVKQQPLMSMMLLRGNYNIANRRGGDLIFTWIMPSRQHSLQVINS